jgi:isoquinoline 1-oxidoreductase subunit beta
MRDVNEDHGEPAPKRAAPMERRFFLGVVLSAGAGLVIGCGETTASGPAPATGASPKSEAPKPEAKAEPPKEPFAPDQWIRVAPDGKVTVIIDKAEMGQGIETALSMLVAEELEVPLSAVKTEFAPADPQKYRNKLFGTQATGGSTSVRGDYVALRKAGAAARIMLIGAAAEKLGVPAAELRAEGGVVVHAGSGKKVAYGELVELAAKQPVPKDPPLKDASEFKVIGTRPPRLDATAKGSGKAVFGIDVKVPGALTAIVVRCPVPGGKVAKFDAQKALAVAGVRKAFAVSTGVAVVADHFWAAKQGAQALAVTWDEGEGAKISSESILEEAKALVKKPGAVAEKKGDFEKAYKGAKQKIEIAYDLPFQAHAPMEPQSCTAHVRADGCDLWVPTQSPERVADIAKKITGLDAKAIQVHTTFLGGTFGRKFELDYVTEALESSKAAGAPVKVVWTREDETRHDFYRPASYTVARAGIDDKGMPVGVSYRVVSASIMTRVFPGNMKNGIDHAAIEGLGESYAFPTVLTDYHMQNRVPVGFWRSVGHSVNAFIQETLMDELAHMAKQDPVEYRRKLLAENPRMRGVLDVAAEKGGWGKAMEKGTGRGIAVHHSFGSYVAQVAEVTVGPKGEVKVDRVVCAVDCGAVVHPGLVEAQMEGAIVFGLTAALKSSIRFEGGRVKQSNFHNFKLLTMEEAPRIEVHVVQSRENPGGVGEPGTPPIAPAVANAIFAATGKRVRKLPVEAKELKA